MCVCMCCVCVCVCGSSSVQRNTHREIKSIVSTLSHESNFSVSISVLPSTTLLQEYVVPHYVQGTPLPGSSHHQSITLAQESNYPALVATHQAKYHHITFMTL